MEASPLGEKCHNLWTFSSSELHEVYQTSMAPVYSKTTMAPGGWSISPGECWKHVVKNHGVIHPSNGKFPIWRTSRTIYIYTNLYNFPIYIYYFPRYVFLHLPGLIIAGGYILRVCNHQPHRSSRQTRDSPEPGPNSQTLLHHIKQAWEASCRKVLKWQCVKTLYPWWTSK